MDEGRCLIIASGRFVSPQAEKGRASTDGKHLKIIVEPVCQSSQYNNSLPRLIINTPPSRFRVAVRTKPHRSQANPDRDNPVHCSSRGPQSKLATGNHRGCGLATIAVLHLVTFVVVCFS